MSARIGIVNSAARLKCSIRSHSTSEPRVLLETRAKAAIERPKEQKPTRAAQELTASKYPEFHALLKSWRNLTAKTLDLPGHMVLPRGTLLKIANELPVTQQSLLGIKGMGPKKTKRFGAEILEMTVAFREKHNIALSFEEPVAGKSEAPVKGETQKLSFELFLSGKTVAEIAVKRKLKISTIEEHLSFFVGTGQLAVEKLVSSYKIARISDYFSRVEDTRLGPAEAALGDDVSYGEIKCVLKHLEYLQRGENCQQGQGDKEN